MALGEFSIFTWKSRATQEREQEEYALWAFPHGQKQRDNLEKLLLEVYPKETVPTTLIPFLTCKELYESVLKKAGSRDLAVETLINNVKKYKQIIKKKNMTTYIALVLADADIDELCEYPSADDIRSRALAFDELRTK